MIARIFLTLALASSFALTAGQEKPKNVSFIDPNQSYTKTFTQLTVAASLLSMGIGIYKNDLRMTNCGFGLLTGLGCAAYEHKTDCSFVRSWIGEMVVRHSFTGITAPSQDAYYNYALPASEAGSWTGYLGYCVVNAMDKE